MNNNDSFIADTPLPEALNIELLRNIGIKQLQALSGTVWTNYNETDPGITILDQLCYALTELGYCAQFPIEDVLTQEDGEIHFNDQFFEPQNILTCSPVTADDYRKLVYDNAPEVRVIYIEAEADDGDYTGRYHSYLSVKNNVPQKDVEQVINRVHVLLNQHRNLAELFMPPEPLKAVDIELTGDVWLTSSADVAKVESLISEALLNYVAPLPIQSGYKELVSEGLESEQIFNGPKLHHGWIAGSDAPGRKCSSVSLSSLTTLIASIDGVLYVESLSLVVSKNSVAKLNESGSEIKIDLTEIPNISLSKDFQLLRNGVPATTQEVNSSQPYLAALSASHQATGVEAKVDLYPDLPCGQYRNIEEYYSVQNTFPDIYGIGHNSLQSDASSHRVAISRQLKGYLMSFDQLLANQFSQLAHIGDLFSFPMRQSESTPGTDSTTPHRQFATTYYCQPLYDIPLVKPLLRGNEAFHYQFDSDKSDKQVENDAWKKYQEFQFNEYIYGLRQCVESASEASSRRDLMLTHLMARHGEDARLYDDMIETCQWFGSELKTRIIVKTIWLQNFQKLSYNRTRAFDIYAVNKLPAPGDASIINALDSGKPTGEVWWQQHAYPAIDGEVDQAKIYADAKLNKTDFENFSAFELKLGILLGLSARWKSLAAKLYALLNNKKFKAWAIQPDQSGQIFKLPDSEISIKREKGKDQLFEGQQCLLDIVWKSQTQPASEDDYQAHADQLLWLSTQRRGFLLIESTLLLAAQWPVNSTPNFLTVSLLFPDYVTLIQHPNFKSYIDTLLKLHSSAHIKTSYLPKSFDFMKALIPRYVEWNNNQDASNNNALSTQLAELLLPDKGAD